MTQKQLEMNSQLFGLLQEICTSETLMAKGIKALQRVLNNNKNNDNWDDEDDEDYIF